jgi:hypothetical protein
MAEINQVQQAVEQVVAQVFAAQVPRLQAEIVQRVLEAMPAPSAAGVGGEAAKLLLQAVAGVQTGTTQKEILRALVEGGSAHCARTALFVVKAGTATGWQGRGFADDDSLKDFALDMHAGPVSHAYQNRVVAPANIAEMGARFVEQFGAPANEQVLVLPLVLKDKVAALVYADGGATGVLDGTSLEVLVMATSAWLEVVSLRKQAQQRETPQAASEPSVVAPVQTVSSFADPFASHAPIAAQAPKHVPAAIPEPEPEPVPELVEVASSPHAAPSAAAAPATAADPFAGLSAEDADTHRKAQRFARLLVDEIKLYNQAKVAEGRKHKDLYDRMKDDIEKSRSTFQKRYGSTIANSGNYFQQELVRSLAEDDISIMGANFKR